jgi:hypothetical protein
MRPALPRPSRMTTMARIMSRLPVVALAALALTGIAAKPASALTFQCVEPSRYKNLLPVFSDDPNLFFSYFGLERQRLPDLNSCRALLVAGTLAAGDADAILDRIIQGKGWLALLYLQVDGANIQEEAKAALIVRAFALKTRGVRHASYRYQPDFALRWDPLVSLAGTSAAPMPVRDVSPLGNGLKTFNDRTDLLLRLDQRQAFCGNGCRTIFAGGVNRLYNIPPANTPAPATTSDPATTRARAVQFQQLELNRTPGANDPALSKPLDWAAATPPATARMLRDKCNPEFAVADSLEGRFGDAFTAAARNKYSPRAIEALASDFEALTRGGVRLQQCLAAALERARLEAFQNLCKTTCDKPDLSNFFANGAREILEKASKL